MKKMVFGQFRMQCEEMYNAFKEHSTMHDLRVWDSFPSDTLKERQCWYCCVRLTDDVQMMITFDPEDDDPQPYMCWYDYPVGTVNYSHWNFATLEDAMIFISKEPHHNYRSYHRDNYCLYRKIITDNGKKMWQSVVGLSILNSLDFIKNTPKFPEGDWEIRKISDFKNIHEGDVIYRIHVDSEYSTNEPFITMSMCGLPDSIYENEE